MFVCLLHVWLAHLRLLRRRTGFCLDPWVFSFFCLAGLMPDHWRGQQSFIVPLITYLYHYTHYTPPTFIAGKSLYLSRVLSFLAFFGGVSPNRWVAALLGLVILAILLVAIRSRFDRANPTAFYFTVWVVATGGVVSWVRGAIAFQTWSRISIYSCLVLIFCYSFLAWYLSKRSPNLRQFYVTSILAAVVFCFFADLDAERNLEARRRMALTGIENYRADPKNNSPMNAPLLPDVILKETEFEREVLTQAIERGIYSLPPRQ